MLCAAARVLHARCLKRLKFGSVLVSLPEFPLAAETEELRCTGTSAAETLEAALCRLGIQGDSSKQLSHEEELLQKYQQTIKETPGQPLLLLLLLLFVQLLFVQLLQLLLLVQQLFLLLLKEQQQQLLLLFVCLHAFSGQGGVSST